jgi:hypothetical protein
VTAVSAGMRAAVPDAQPPVPTPSPNPPASALPPPENSGAALFAARPSLIRAMNEQLLLEHIRQRGRVGADEQEARKRGTLEAAASASGVVRAARRGGMRGPVSARRVFEAAAGGDERAMAVVAEEAQLIAKTICAVITVVDPDLIVLGGIGRAPGFAEVVTSELERIAPVMPAIRVSALGTDAVVDGCLAAGTELAWSQVMTVLPTAPSPDGLRQP